MTKRTRELELSVAGVREESRKGVEAARQAAAGKAGLSDLEVCGMRRERVFATMISFAVSALLERCPYCLRWQTFLPNHALP